ncbi:Uu.00g142140.m01.CDS01 [Anthostomella pinea]|uniref:Carboxylic ester hydrolase n=1 Tax=Anthostomella pinea TaxID=933095 RepID=A0AAI8VQE8_9PEZI|nr:Uu.00g142140.m01.CDS01 [Anthostomella pinea]
MERVARLVAVGLALIAASSASSVTRDADKPTVDLGYEVHQGTVNSTGNYYIFSNVPYAEQPIDALRFQKPTAPTGNFSDVNKGTNDVMCMQAYPLWIIQLLASDNKTAYAAKTDEFLDAAGQTEACLVLDVRVPVDVFEAGSAANAPVIVWIHGGGFTYGSKSSDGNPAGLIARSQADGGDGVIVVSINYRLGLFGWLAGDDVTPNLGLYDQRLALEWVQQYIGLFGGSPERVTVMGESAGASSVVHHITAYGGTEPAPFQSAIPQSPAFQFNIDLAEAYQKTLTEASSQTGVTVNGVAALSELSSATLSSVNQAVVYNAAMGLFVYGVGPDGTYVPKIPQILLYEGNFNHDINLMISHTSNESVPFTPTNISTSADLLAEVYANFPEASNDTITTLLTDIYPDVLDGTYPWTTQFARAVQIASEIQFSCITGYLARAAAGASHNYVFAYPPGYHAADLPYVWLNGEGAVDDGLPVDANLARALQYYIVAFARSGDPNAGLGGEAVEFPVYGDGGAVLKLAYGGFVVGVDDVKNERCDWIQQAMVDGLI